MDRIVIVVRSVRILRNDKKTMYKRKLYKNNAIHITILLVRNYLYVLGPNNGIVRLKNPLYEGV